MRHLAWLALLAGACSFPAVDYTDPPCDVPAACKFQAANCGNVPRDTLDKCLKDMGCMNDPLCKAGCNADYDDSIQECNHSCQTCALENGCKNSASSCATLIGP